VGRGNICSGGRLASDLDLAWFSIKVALRCLSKIRVEGDRQIRWTLPDQSESFRCLKLERNVPLYGIEYGNQVAATNVL